MYSEGKYMLIMAINFNAYLVLLIFLALSYGVSYAIIPNVPDKLRVKISFPSFNQQIPLGELPVIGTSSDNESSLIVKFISTGITIMIFIKLEQQVREDILTFQHGYTCTARKII